MDRWQHLAAELINFGKLGSVAYDVDNINECYTCKHLIICTGLSKPNIPKEISGIEHAIGYEELELNDNEYPATWIMINMDLYDELGLILDNKNIQWKW